MKSMLIRATVQIILLLSCSIIIQAAESEILPIARIKEPIEFSGSTTHTIWAEATPLQLVMHTPSFGTAAGEQTEVRLGYDNEYLWIFARLHYADASKMVASSKKRDEESKNSDSFGIILDTYDDNESALAFFTTPSGQRIDYAISNDAVFLPTMMGSGNLNYSWNTFWDVKTARIQDGWSVEMRIPFSSLRFQEKDGVVKMGLILNRTISHCNEVDTYPEIDPKYGFTAAVKPSLAQTIEFKDIKPVRPIYIAPYTLSGIDQSQILNESATQYKLENSPQLTGGLDMKYSINSNLTLDVTANTDFAQVEADDQQVNITRYSMFFPEKRMFFQERSSIFGFNLGQSQELFYSRRIGLVDGQPVKIYGGARLTGRVGKWDLGILDMQTERFNEAPSENFGVFRARRQVFNANSYMGAMATTRIGRNGQNSMAYGADGVFRLFGDDYLESRFAQTSNSNGSIEPNSMDNSFAFVRWERRTDKGFAYNLTYNYAGLNFNPSAGFMSRLGTTGISLRTQYGWIPDENSKLMNYKFSLGRSYSRRVVDGGLESSFWSGGFNLLTKTGWSVMTSLMLQREGIINEFCLSSDVSVPAGEYAYSSLMSMFSTPMSKPLVFELMASGGGYYDGKRISLNAEPTLNLSSSVQLSGSYSYNHIQFEKRDQQFNSHIGRIKLMYMYNTKLSLSSFVQYNSVNAYILGNFRLRYNPKEGNDFYLVYNETRPGNDYSFGEAPEVSFLNRTVLLKYVYTFRI